MNIDNKDNIDIEKDDLNIKTHLNASLDKEGIYVSENLRKRTKESILEQESETLSDKEKIKRISNFMVSVASVVLFIFIASSILNIIVKRGVKSIDDSYIKNDYLADNAVEENTAESAQAPEATRLDFKEITKIFARDVNYIKIKDMDSEIEKGLGQEDFEKFFSIMEGYKYTEEEETVGRESATRFVIEVKSESEKMILHIGEKVILGETYELDNSKELIKDLTDLVNED